MADPQLPIDSPDPMKASHPRSNLATSTLSPGGERAQLVARARLLAWGANAWHMLEFALAVAFGAAASSTALIGFGADSLIEALAGFVVIWRFSRLRSESPIAERRAQQLLAVSFILLAGYVVVETIRRSPAAAILR